MPTERDVDRYLLVIAAVYERTAQAGLPDRLAANLRRAVASMPTDPDALTEWDVRAGLAAATFLADVDFQETRAILDRIAPAVARLGGAMPVLQADLDHRRIVQAAMSGDFEDALERVELAEQHTARHGLIGFEVHHRFARGMIALEQGDYAAAAAQFERADRRETWSARLSAPSWPASPSRRSTCSRRSICTSSPTRPVRPIEVELQPHLVASHAFELVGDRARARAEAEREVAIRRRYGSDAQTGSGAATSGVLPPRARSPWSRCSRRPSRSPSRPRVVPSGARAGVVRRALRRAGRDQEAREVLYRAADLAARWGWNGCGARLTVSCWRPAAGPVVTRVSGPAPLTDAQREAADLAAPG